MLKCFGNKEYEITYWKKVQGYGLRATNFDDFEFTSRRAFSGWKDGLLEKKLITKLKSRKERPYFSITPLGICHLGSLLENIDANNAKYMIKFLSYYSTIDLTFSIWEKILDIIGEKESNLILKRICDSIEIKESNNEILILVRYESRRRIIYEIDKYRIFNGQIYVQLDEGTIISNPQNRGEPIHEQLVDEHVFEQEIAGFILKAFCYSVVESCHSKILSSEKAVSYENFSNKTKSIFRDIINENKNILEKLPYDVHSIAAELIERDLLGRTKKHIILLKEISEHYYQKVAPNEGIRWTFEDGNPMNVFDPKFWGFTK